jgi:glyoxylase-like metal-dependent hydrolase (beta-lactamase superfamily II)
MDRTIGAKNLDCPILAHRESAKSLHEPSNIVRDQVQERGASSERYSEASGMNWMIPDITFSERIQLHWAEDPLLIEHHPGPRPGSCWVVLPTDKVLFIGDAVTVKGPPFLGKAHLPTWIDTLDVLLRVRYKEYTLISGRGGPIVHDQIRELKKSLRKIHRRLEKLASRRASAADAGDLADKFLDEFLVEKRDREFFLQRLKHGLSQYYTRNYFPKVEDNH